MAEVRAAQMVIAAFTARAMAVKDVDWDLVSSYAGLLSLATFCVYTGAYGSLSVCMLSWALTRHSFFDVLETEEKSCTQVWPHDMSKRRKSTRTNE